MKASLLLNRQYGQAMTEYLIAMMVTMLLVGVSFSGEESVIDLFLAAVNTAFDHLSGFMSLPL
jgi:hypothetical protein